MWLKTLILFMTVFLMAFGEIGNGDCEDAGVNLKDLIGIWKPDLRQGALDIVLKFRGDGSFGIAYSVEKLDTRPVDRGQVKFEVKIVTFVSSDRPT